jgi:hypothetical protein
VITQEERTMKKAKRSPARKRAAATKTRAAKATAAKPATAARATKSKRLTDAELIAVARKAVPERLHSRGTLTRQGTARGLARAGGPGQTDMAAEVAKLVDAKLTEHADEAVVDFAEETPLGTRHTAVHMRQGTVSRVVTRAKR